MLRTQRKSRSPTPESTWSGLGQLRKLTASRQAPVVETGPGAKGRLHQLRDECPEHGLVWSTDTRQAPEGMGRVWEGLPGCSDHVVSWRDVGAAGGQRGWGCRSPGGAGSGGSVPGGLRKLSLFPRGPRPQVTCVSGRLFGAGWGVGESEANGPLTALSPSCLWTRQGIPGRDTILMCFTCPA